jgi:hypothetical protein
VTLGAGAELKENPGAEVIVAEGELRLMMLGDEACMFAPKAEDDAMTDEAGAETSACDGLTPGADEQAAPDAVTVESNRTVLTPSGPVELKVDVLFDAPGLGVAVDAGAEDDGARTPPKLKLGEELAAGVAEEDKGVEEMALEATIPPKLNVLVAGKELNCRLFRLMTDGGAPGALRSMTDGEGAGALRSMTDGEGAGGLRLMTGGPCGPAIRPTSEGLFRTMMLGDGAVFAPSGEITPRCISSARARGTSAPRPTCARNVRLRTSVTHGRRGRSYSYSHKQRNQKHFGEHDDEKQGKCL